MVVFGSCVVRFLAVAVASLSTKETLKWEAPRRLSQLRGELHDRIKFSMEITEYRTIFDDTPFAHSGGDLA